MILVVVVDVFVTILSTWTAGPVTRTWSRPVWRVLLAVHRRRHIHRLLGLAGPAILALTILLWYAGLVLGAWLVFVSHPGSVVSSSTRLPADAAQTLYFVPTTVSALGYGDYVPAGVPWTTFATTMTLLGTVVLTMSLSYVISVLSAAIATRTMASSIRGLGENPAAIAARAELDSPTRSMQVYLGQVASAVSDVAERHRAYPVLHYFHSSRARTAAAPAVLCLADAAFLLHVGDPAARPGPGLASALESAVADYAQAKTTPQQDTSAGRGALIKEAAELRIPTGLGSDFDHALPAYLAKRRTLEAACAEDGWPAASRSA